MVLLTGPQTKLLYRHATENKYGMVALNPDSKEMIEAAFRAADKTRAPFMIEYSEWQARSSPFGGGTEDFIPGQSLKFANGNLMRGMAEFFNYVLFLAESPEYRHIPVALHVDHFPDEKGPIAAIKGEPRKDYLVLPWYGGNSVVSSVSFDAKKYGRDLDRIIEITKNIGEAAQTDGIALEAEPTEIGTEPTSYEETTRIAQEVGKYVDIYAPNLGSIHGQTTRDGSPVQLDLVRRHREIMSLAKDLSYLMGIAFHGTSGFNDEQLQKAVEEGGIKFNTCTAALGEWARAQAAYLREFAEQIKAGSKDMKSASTRGAQDTYIHELFIPFLEDRIKVLGGEGKAESALEFCLKDN